MNPFPRRALPSLLVSSIIITIAAAPAAWAKSPVATGTGGAVATISEQASQSALTLSLIHI